MPRKAADPRDVFAYYFAHGLNKEDTLLTFHLQGTKRNPDYANRWSVYKYDHIDDYEYCKRVYFEFKDINERSIIDRVNDIANDPSNKAVQLKALELLYSILTSSNEKLFTRANKLVVEIVDSKEEDNV